MKRENLIPRVAKPAFPVVIGCPRKKSAAVRRLPPAICTSLSSNSALPGRYHNAVILRRNNVPACPPINLAKLGSMNL